MKTRGRGSSPITPLFKEISGETNVLGSHGSSISVHFDCCVFVAALGSSTVQLRQLHVVPVVCPSEVPSPWTLLSLSKILLRLGGC